MVVSAHLRTRARRSSVGVTALIALSLLLSACGQGSSGSNADTAASPSVSPSASLSGDVSPSVLPSSVSPSLSAEVSPAPSASPSPSASAATSPQPSPTVSAAPAQPSAQPTAVAGSSGATRTIRYLGKTYTIPSSVSRVVVTGSLEAMEDALLLDVRPVGAMTVGGKFPAMFAPITGSAVSIGEKAQPNFEAILKLKPDVIFGTTKFNPDVLQKLEKIAPTIPVSHIATNWEANLRVLAEVTGKQDRVDAVLSQYRQTLANTRAKLGDRYKEKKVVVVRIRNGDIMIYRDDIYLNPTLYGELGLPVPLEIKTAQSQQSISLEKFSEINPDVLFVQFAEEENPKHPKALDDLKNNPIWNSIRAVRDGRVYVNVVDPMAQGGTAWSKIQFLKAVADKLGG